MEQPAMTASEAAEGVKRIRPLLEGIIGLAETLEHVGDIEQAMEESQLRLKASRDKESETQHALASLQADIAAAQGKMSEIEDAALAKLEAAEQQAAGMLDQAKAQAEDVLKAAEEEAKTIIAKAQARQDDIQDAIKEREERLAKAESELFAKGEELAALNTSIAETKAQMKKLLQQAE